MPRVNARLPGRMVLSSLVANILGKIFFHLKLFLLRNVGHLPGVTQRVDGKFTILLVGQ